LRRSRATFGHPFRALALVMLLFVTPGALELLEDSVHFLVHDDSLHDEGHDSDHCCSGPFHFCSCHAPSVAAPTLTGGALIAQVSWHATASARAPGAVRVGPADDHARQLDRPPAA